MSHTALAFRLPAAPEEHFTYTSLILTFDNPAFANTVHRRSFHTILALLCRCYMLKSFLSQRSWESVVSS